MTVTTKQQTEITSPAIARGTDKLTHEVFYVVKSDTQENTWYTVRWNNAACQWQCNCPAHKPCKHERAVNEVLKIRRARIALAMGGQTPKIVAKLQAEEDRKLASEDDLRFSSWHGSNRDAERKSERLTREAYVEEFDPCTVPGMY